MYLTSFVIIKVIASVDLDLFAAGFNFYVLLQVDSINTIEPIKVIVDTGNNQLTVIQDVVITSPNYPCLFLTEDSSYVSFVNNASIPTNLYFGNGQRKCLTTASIISYPTNNFTSSINGNFTVSNALLIYNSKLHSWNTTNGDIGLSYNCNSIQCYPTIFQSLLSVINNTYKLPEPLPNSTMQYQVFGLDLNGKEGNSTMQLGKIKEEYEKNISWIPQAQNTPTYHSFFIYNLEFCGQQLFSNYSQTWPVLVDTGSVCLTLPEEAYNTLSNWLNINSVLNSVYELPVLSFSVDGDNENIIYIPLSTLVVDEGIINSPGLSPLVVPNITISGLGGMNLCVIQGKAIESGNSYSTPVPMIVFGTMVLQSVYFAAEFTSKSVGIAGKFSASNLNNMSSITTCMKPTQCIGEQLFSPETNSCSSPPCSNFYFMKIDDDTQTCQYKSTPLGFGLFFILMITILEFISYFTLQYSSYQVLESSSTDDTGIYSMKRYDRGTLLLGRFSSSIIDWLLSRVLHWVENARDNHRRINIEENIVVDQHTAIE